MLSPPPQVSAPKEIKWESRFRLRLPVIDGFSTGATASGAEVVPRPREGGEGDERGEGQRGF